jgi:protein SCO1/2
VTTDPARDTAAIMARWLGYFRAFAPVAHWVALRGTQAQTDTAQAASHIMIAEDAGQTHSAAVLLFGADDYARVQFVPSNDGAQQIAHDLPLVAT